MDIIKIMYGDLDMFRREENKSVPTIENYNIGSSGTIMETSIEEITPLPCFFHPTLIFYNQSDLIEHVQNKHRDQIKLVVHISYFVKNQSCLTCNKDFTNRAAELITHVIKDECVIPVKPLSPDAVFIGPIDGENDSLKSDTDVGSTCTSLEETNIDDSCSGNHREFPASKCYECHKTLDSAFELELHSVEAHLEERFRSKFDSEENKCNLCGMHFNQNYYQELNTHLRTCEGPQLCRSKLNSQNSSSRREKEWSRGTSRDYSSAKLVRGRGYGRNSFPPSVSYWPGYKPYRPKPYDARGSRRGRGGRPLRGHPQWKKPKNVPYESKSRKRSYSPSRDYYVNSSRRNSYRRERDDSYESPSSYSYDYRSSNKRDSDDDDKTYKKKTRWDATQKIYWNFPSGHREPVRPAENQNNQQLMICNNDSKKDDDTGPASQQKESEISSTSEKPLGKAVETAKAICEVENLRSRWHTFLQNKRQNSGVEVVNKNATDSASASNTNPQNTGKIWETPSLIAIPFLPGRSSNLAICNESASGNSNWQSQYKEKQNETSLSSFIENNKSANRDVPSSAPTTPKPPQPVNTNQTSALVSKEGFQDKYKRAAPSPPRIQHITVPPSSPTIQITKVMGNYNPEQYSQHSTTSASVISKPLNTTSSPQGFENAPKEALPENRVNPVVFTIPKTFKSPLQPTPRSSFLITGSEGSVQSGQSKSVSISPNTYQIPRVLNRTSLPAVLSPRKESSQRKSASSSTTPSNSQSFNQEANSFRQSEKTRNETDARLGRTTTTFIPSSTPVQGNSVPVLPSPPVNDISPMDPRLKRLISSYVPSTLKRKETPNGPTQQVTLNSSSSASANASTSSSKSTFLKDSAAVKQPVGAVGPKKVIPLSEYSNRNSTAYASGGGARENDREIRGKVTKELPSSDNNCRTALASADCSRTVNKSTGASAGDKARAHLEEKRKSNLEDKMNSTNAGERGKSNFEDKRISNVEEKRKSNTEDKVKSTITGDKGRTNVEDKGKSNEVKAECSEPKCSYTRTETSCKRKTEIERSSSEVKKQKIKFVNEIRAGAKLRPSEIYEELLDCPCGKRHESPRSTLDCVRKLDLDICYICTAITKNNTDSIIEHCLSAGHFKNGSFDELKVRCPFPDCGKHFDYQRGIKNHLTRMHFPSTTTPKLLLQDAYAMIRSHVPYGISNALAICDNSNEKTESSKLPLPSSKEKSKLSKDFTVKSSIKPKIVFPSTPPVRAAATEASKLMRRQQIMLSNVDKLLRDGPMPITRTEPSVSKTSNNSEKDSNKPHTNTSHSSGKDKEKDSRKENESRKEDHNHRKEKKSDRNGHDRVSSSSSYQEPSTISSTNLPKKRTDSVCTCSCCTAAQTQNTTNISLSAYESHLKCIGEENQVWVNTVNDILKQGGNSLNRACRNLLQTLAKHDNVPIKKTKFLKFIRNISEDRFDDGTINTVWDLLEEQWKAQTASIKMEPIFDPNEYINFGKVYTVTSTTDDSTTEIQSESQEDETVQGTKLRKRKKKEVRRKKQYTRVSEEELENAAVESDAETVAVRQTKSKNEKKKLQADSDSEFERKKTKRNKDADAEVIAEVDDFQYFHIYDEDEEPPMRVFNWKRTIKDVLSQHPDHEISMKKLRKKVFAEYYAVVGVSKSKGNKNKSKEELILKLNKILKKHQFQVKKEVKVKLL